VKFKNQQEAHCSLLSYREASSLRWWLDPGWVAGVHKAALSLPSSAGQGRENNERLKGRDKDREGSLTNYCHGQNTIALGKL